MDEKKKDLNWAARRAGATLGETAVVGLGLNEVFRHIKEKAPNLYKGPWTKANAWRRVKWQLPVAGLVAAMNVGEAVIEKKSEEDRKTAPWAIARGTPSGAASVVTGLSLQSALNKDYATMAPKTRFGKYIKNVGMKAEKAVAEQGWKGRVKYLPHALIALSPFIAAQTAMGFGKGWGEKKIERAATKALYGKKIEGKKMDKKAEINNEMIISALSKLAKCSIKKQAGCGAAKIMPMKRK
jgi:hypothetical protein